MTFNLEAFNDRIAWICAPANKGTLESPRHRQAVWADMLIGPENPTAILGQNFCRSSFCLAGDQILNDPTKVFVHHQTHPSIDGYVHVSPEYVIDRPEGFTGEVFFPEDWHAACTDGSFQSVDRAAQMSFGITKTEAAPLFRSSRTAQDLVNLMTAIALRYQQHLTVPEGWAYDEAAVKYWLMNLANTYDEDDVAEEMALLAVAHA